jgi:hypothetical protein
MKISKPLVKGIEQGLYSLAEENIYGLLKNIDYGNFELYHKDGVGYVVNVKNKGYPDNDDIAKLLSKKASISFEEADDIVNKNISELWNDTVSNFFENLSGDYNNNLVTVGRSGGYWGFDVDYFDIGDFEVDTNRFIKDFESELEVYYNENIEDLQDEEDVGIDFISDTFYSDEISQYFSFSKSTEKVLDGFLKELYSQIKEFEEPLIWVNIILKEVL